MQTLYILNWSCIGKESPIPPKVSPLRFRIFPCQCKILALARKSKYKSVMVEKSNNRNVTK